MLQLPTWLPWMNAAVCGTWLFTLSLACYRIIRLPAFRPVPSPTRPSPRLSVVIAACNEAETLEPALRSLLEQDYEHLQIVLVDDRSTDGTSELVDRLAAEDERITPLHVTELPGGWLGKLNALREGTRRADGEWLLFTDADVRFGPDTLRETLHFAIAGGYDHVSLVPWVECTSFAQRILTEAFGVALVLSIPMHRVPHDAERYFGVGAFNLVRRDLFERSEGFEWLRMEIADDMGLALMLRRHGSRPFAGRAWEWMSVQWYGSLGDMIRGLEKNLFATAGQYSWARVAAAAVAVAVWLFVPLVGAMLPAPLGWPASLAVVGALAGVAMVAWRHQGSNPLAFVLLPVGVGTLAFATVRSAMAYQRNGGAVWRGTLYRTEELREGQRVKL